MSKNLNNFRNSKFWQKLLIKQQTIKKTSINKLFLTDQNRFKKFSFNINDLNLLVDFSKQHLDEEVMSVLCDAAKYCELDSKIKDLFNGTKINITENKQAWHTMLRDSNHHKNFEDILEKMGAFSQKLYNSNYNNILCLGIGGSYLGPVMVFKALDKYTNPPAKKFTFDFIANTDQETIDNVLSKLVPEKTIVIINSKSFTTSETILNAKIILDWFKEKLPGNHKNLYQNQIFAVTCNVNKAMEFGVLQDNIFPFAEFVGGRYSVWSAVGLSIVIKLGLDGFKKFLRGAELVDQHFRNTDFAKNIPVIMALISLWNINFMQYKSLAVIPYIDALEKFPDYLQQLAMESNGKTIDLQNNQINYDSAEIVWGGVGCNVQHSFMQMLHQGSQIVPVDFLVATNKGEVLFANCVAQSQALMQGNISQPGLDNFKRCIGDRPSTTILFQELTPEVLGSLIALYEHKIFVQGVMWNINSFDQWGVELGKNLTIDLLRHLKTKETDLELDIYANNNLATASMVGLINKYKHLQTSTNN